MWGFVFNEVFQLKLSQKVFYLKVFWYYMWFFLVFTTSPTSMNDEHTKHKTPNSGRSIVMSWLANLWLATLALLQPHKALCSEKRSIISWHQIPHMPHQRVTVENSKAVMAYDPMSSFWDRCTAKAQIWSRCSWIRILCSYLFIFFKHLPYLEDNDRLSKDFNLTKGAILKSYYHDTLVPITHQNKNKQVNKSFK